MGVIVRKAIGFRASLAAKILAAACFLILALAKAISLDYFAAALFQMGTMPEAYTKTAALAIVALEALAGIGLLVPRTLEFGAKLGLLLTGGFIAFSLYRIATHMPMPCGCLGSFYSLAPIQALFLAIILNLLVVLGSIPTVKPIQ